MIWWCGLAWSGQQDFEKGLAALRSGDHQEAIEVLGELDIADPTVFHALGNAYYRAGERGRAMATWHKGLALAPRNGDIRGNLDRARAEGVDRLDPVSQPTPFFWQRSLSTWESGWLASLWLSLGFWLLVLMRWLRKNPVRKAPVVLRWISAVSIGLGALLAASTLQASMAPEVAVVIVDEARARSTVGAGGMELFVLHEGAEVTIAERAGASTLVVLPDQRKGWVATMALMKGSL